MTEGVEEGYRHYFRGELADEDAVILAAELDGRVVGYAYGRLEPRDWNLLMDACGALHDVFVDPQARREGIARALVSATIEALEAKGAPRVLLHTATQNEAAQRLFESLGFRRTMIEMARERSSGSSRG
jgi:ribosomal protein S18 acetylase RimI-like enzyme